MPGLLDKEKVATNENLLNVSPTLLNTIRVQARVEREVAARVDVGPCGWSVSIGAQSWTTVQEGGGRRPSDGASEEGAPTLVPSVWRDPAKRGGPHALRPSPTGTR